MRGYLTQARPWRSYAWMVSCGILGMWKLPVRAVLEGLPIAAPVTVDLIQGLEFEELPSSARVYITVRAARKYQDRYFGDDSTHSYYKQDELEALVSLKN
ncbi:hypothetical protein CN109_38105, partial [Sinorhizobium meliloti]